MRNYITVILFMSLLMYIVVGLDIPIFRQIIGFIYLSFIPGFLVLRLFKLDELSAIDNILLSFGLSIAILIFVGFLMNALFPVFGVSKPLSILPLILTLSIITFVMSIISYRRNNKSSSLIKSTKLIPKALLFTAIPVLAVCGAWLEISPILLLTVVIIAALILVTTLSKRLVPTKLYPFIVIIIAVSLLFHMSLISKYLTGWDMFSEYYIYSITKSNSLWNTNIPFNSLQLSTYNAMLSVTVLPTLFSNLLNIQGEWVFKIVYLLIFSFVPLALYQTWEQKIGKITAFLSSFLFMFYPSFFAIHEMRQIIAELFLVLLFFLILTNKIKGKKRAILLIIFATALIVSHYSTSYIFLFTIFFSWFFSLFLKRHFKSDSGVVSGSLILLFIVLAFSWYTYVSSSVVNVFLNFINNISNSFFSYMFNLEYRGQISNFANPLSAPSFLHIVDNILPKILYFFILIGFLGLFISRMKYAKLKFNLEYTLMMTANIGILFAVILVPLLGPSFVTTRFFHISLILLAPLCVLGGQTFFVWVQNLARPVFVVTRKSNALVKKKALHLVCVLLVIIFLFKIGFLYEVTGDVPTSQSLSKGRMETSNNTEIKTSFFNYYVPEQDVFSAMWISKVIGEESKIYADVMSQKKALIGYGHITPNKILHLNNDTTTIETGGYIYLRYQNVIDGTLIYINRETETFESSNVTEVSFLYSNINRIYSNGFSEVYQSPRFLNITRK